jgi:hypothetical protein
MEAVADTAVVVHHAVADAMSCHCTEVHECAGHIISFEVLEGSAPMVKHVVAGYIAK